MSVELVIERDVQVPMRDGTVLRADVWRPHGMRRAPALLQRTPYDKALWLMAHAPIDPARAVEAGYAVVIQDVRGRSASAGTFEPFRQEIDDGADSVAWVAQQPWSDGWVGMYGGSYVGATQLLAALAAPPALRAIVPAVTGSEYYEGWTYQGGALQLGFVLQWARGLAAGELARRGEDANALNAELADPWNAYCRLPVSDQPLLEGPAPYFRDWLAHPARDAYWRETAIDDDYARITVPALHVGGWNDIFIGGTLANYRGLRDAGVPGQRLLVGPWAHGTMGEMIGDVSYGADGSRWAIDSTAFHLDFFEQVRDGEQAGSPVRVFVLGENRWRDLDDWPPPGVDERRLHLRAEGRLGWEQPSAGEEADAFVHDPHDPVPTAGGATLLPGHEISIMLGQRDQAAIEARSDVLVYRSEPLARPLTIAGSVRLVLHAATTGHDIDWTARLVDVDLAGRAIGIVDGILRARFRNGLEREELLEPGRVYRFEIDVGDVCVTLGAGHRIGLQVASSNFPRFDRNPGSGSRPADARAEDFCTTRQTVHHDADRPSFLVLPIAGE